MRTFRFQREQKHSTAVTHLLCVVSFMNIKKPTHRAEKATLFQWGYLKDCKNRI